MSDQVNEQLESEELKGETDVTVQVKQAELLRKIRNGANWFFCLAVLSFINSLMVGPLMEVGQTDITFIAGLGVTQVVDGYVIGTYGEPHVTGTIINTGIAALFIWIGVKAGKASLMAFIAGLSLYALDAGIFVYLRSWKEVIFHGLALYFMFKGFKAIRDYNEFRDKLFFDHLVTNPGEGI